MMLNATDTSSTQRAARLAGVLFIVSTLAGVLNFAILGSIQEGTNYLSNLTTHENRVIVGVLLDLICAGAFVAIAVVLFPILHKLSDRWALGYLVARSFEAIPFVIGVVCILLLMTLGRQAHEQSESVDVVYLQSMSALLLGAYDWTVLLGPMIFFSLTVLILNYLLYRSRLVPRLLSVWGFIGGLLILAAGLFALFDIFSHSSVAGNLLTLPIASQEMVFAVWLIVKGFNSRAANAG